MPFDVAGSGAGSAAAAKLLLKLSSPCFVNGTAGALSEGYTALSAEKHLDCRASLATAAKAARLAPIILGNRAIGLLCSICLKTPLCRSIDGPRFQGVMKALIKRGMIRRGPFPKCLQSVHTGSVRQWMMLCISGTGLGSLQMYACLQHDCVLRTAPSCQLSRWP